MILVPHLTDRVGALRVSKVINEMLRGADELLTGIETKVMFKCIVEPPEVLLQRVWAAGWELFHLQQTLGRLAGCARDQPLRWLK